MAILGLRHNRLQAGLFGGIGHRRHYVGRFVVACAFLASLVVATLIFAPAAEAQREADANKVKAAFVFQFANFVEWPDEAFESDRAPFIITIVGNEEIEKLLADAAKDKRVQGRPIRVEDGDASDDLSKCHIVFVDDSQSGSGTELIDRYMDSPVLLVSDSEEFTKDGGTIRLFERSNRLKIEINVDAAERANLQVSSKLLSLATVVHDR